MKSRIIDIRGLDAALYELLTAWWQAHGWNPVPLAILPRCGIWIEDDTGNPLAAAFLYMENSGVGVAWLEWMVTNPAIAPRKAYVAIGVITQAAREVALELDYGVLMTTCRQESLARTLEKNGFSVTDRGVTHLIMFTKE